MRIAIMGAGGIGGCYGALLARAGFDVTLIARGAHLEAITEKGLQLVQPEGDFTVDVAATSNPSLVGPVDLVIFSVKAHQNIIAIPLIKPLVGGDTTVLTVQNGVESADEIGARMNERAIGVGGSAAASEAQSGGGAGSVARGPKAESARPGGGQAGREEQGGLRGHRVLAHGAGGDQDQGTLVQQPLLLRQRRLQQVRRRLGV